MRLLFAETNTSFHEAFQGVSSGNAQKLIQDMKNNIRPFFAVPVIIHTPNDDGSSPILLSQTPVIMRYLASELDHGRLFPNKGIDEYYAMELMSGIVDIVEEGCRGWHAIHTCDSYASQKKETQPFIDIFLDERLPIWLEFFETTLKHNGNKHFVSNKLTYVDLAVFHWLDGVEYQCPELYEKSPIPTLKAFKQSIAKLPRIAQRLQTRTEKYDGTGPIF